MPLDHKRTLAFIHIPRTGGTSIEAALGIEEGFPNLLGLQGRLVLQHLTVREMRERVSATILSGYDWFTVVRNPWDRMVSEWHWWRSVVRLKWAQQMSFLGFVQQIPRLIALGDASVEFHMRRHCWPATWFVRGGGVPIQTLRFETLEEDWTRGGYGPPLGHVHKSDRDPYPSYYDDETRELVGELYRGDVDLYGYEFEEGE